MPSAPLPLELLVVFVLDVLPAAVLLDAVLLDEVLPDEVVVEEAAPLMPAAALFAAPMRLFCWKAVEASVVMNGFFQIRR